MIQNIFLNLIVKLIIKPFINIEISILKNNLCITDKKRDVPIIISISSEEEQFNNLPITLYSLLNQDLKPDKIILWLDKKNNKYNLPYEITQFIKNGLEIEFIENLDNYTQLLSTLKKYPSAIIVTAENHIYYPKTWLKKLYFSYISHPEDIQVNNSYNIILNNNNIKILKYIKKQDASYNYLMDNTGGVLYPPNTFCQEIYRKDIYQKNISKNCNIWFWAMSIINNKKTRIIKNNIKYFFSTSNSKIDKIKSIESELNKVINLYKENIKNKIQ